MPEFEPKIVGFLCNWCSYAGADLAGVSRIQYPPNIRIVRVMCSGRVDPIMVLEALIQGADGVLVAGCHLGDCHYKVGNYEAERKVKMTKKLIELAGIKPGRLRLEWISAAEGERFAEVVKDFTNQIKNLGPNPLGAEKEPSADLLERMLAAKLVAEDFRSRALVGRERTIVEAENAYGEKTPQEDFDEVMDDAIDSEYIRKRIYLLTKVKPSSVREISEHLNLDPKEVLRHIVVMRRKGLTALERIEGTSPLYAAQIQK